MTENEIRTLFEQWVDAWNSHDPERDRPLYAEDVVLYQAPVKKTLVGIEHIINRGKDLFEMSNDARFTVRELHVVGIRRLWSLIQLGHIPGAFSIMSQPGAGLTSIRASSLK